MKYHAFFHYQWIRVKRIFSRQITQYINWIITSLIIIIGLIGSIYSINSNNQFYGSGNNISNCNELNAIVTAAANAHNTSLLLLSSGLIFFGLLCLIYQSLLSREKLRIKRSEGTFCYLHKLTEEIRTFRYENQEKQKTVKEIQQFFLSKTFPILASIFENRYIVEPKITLKHNVDGKLHCVRSQNQSDCNEDLEDSKSHEIFNVFLSHTELFKELFVEDVNLMHKYPAKFIKSVKDNIIVPDNEKSDKAIYKHSQALIIIDRIKQRAKDRYKTFITFPIRKSQFVDAVGQGILRKKTIGFLGLDLNSKYGFGEIIESEWQFLYIYVDQLAEIVDLLNKTLSKE